MNNFFRFNGFRPWYDENADYQTNAKSYYDYLAKKNKLLKWIVNLINRLLRRDIKFNDTPSINFDKVGNWIEVDGKFDDVINVSAKVNLSSSTESLSVTINGSTSSISITNGTVIKTDGVWSPDYKNVVTRFISEFNNIYNRLAQIDSAITNINSEITQIKTRLTNIENRISQLETRVTNIEGDIANIYNQIKDIETVLNQNVTNMTQGTDFDVTFYNNFSAGGNLICSIIDTDFSVTLRFTYNTSNNLICSRCNDFVLRHGSSVGDTPLSRIFGINFKGAYAWLNSFVPVSTFVTTLGSSIWNLQPSSARARWAVFTGATQNSSGQRFLISGVSISDGYNNQLNTGKESAINDVSTDLNLSLEIVMSKDLSTTRLYENLVKHNAYQKVVGEYEEQEELI